jgi:SAM-dependent methyltransferase
VSAANQASRELDPARAEAFGQRMMRALNEAGTVVMVSVGHRTGLLDAMASLPASTADAIADAADLDRRYVREWLGAMVTSGIVEHDGEACTYWLPAEHAACLTRAAAPDNLAALTQFIPVIAGVEDDIVQCFREGGGVPYERYARFHEVMAEDSGQSVLPALEAHILPLVPGLVDRLREGVRVLDAGCGRGRALHLMAQLFPASQFVGYDLSREAIDWARAEADRLNLRNVEFHCRDLSSFADDAGAEAGRYDLVTTFDAIHDQAQPRQLLAGINRALKDDGVYLAQDIAGSGSHAGDRDHPLGPLLYTLSCMHCMSVSLAQGGEGLGAMWGQPTAEAYFGEAGFSQIETHRLEHDPQNAYYVCRK